MTTARTPCTASARRGCVRRVLGQLDVVRARPGPASRSATAPSSSTTWTAARSRARPRSARRRSSRPRTPPAGSGGAVRRPSPATAPHRRQRHQLLPPAVVGEQQPVRRPRPPGPRRPVPPPGRSSATGDPRAPAQPLGQADAAHLRTRPRGRLGPLGRRLLLVELRLQIGEQLLPPHRATSCSEPRCHVDYLRLVAFACFSVASGQRQEASHVRASSGRAPATAMALIAVLLARRSRRRLPTMAGALAAAQRTADTAGPDALVVAAAGLLAWAVWAWGCLGLALTAAAALPGLLGGVAAAGLRRSSCPPARAASAALAARPRASASPAPLARHRDRPPCRPRPPRRRRAGGVPDWPAARPRPGAVAGRRRPRRRARLARRRRSGRRRRTSSSAGTASGTSPRPPARRSRAAARRDGEVAAEPSRPGGRPTPTSSAPTPTCCCPARSCARRSRREPARRHRPAVAPTPRSPR